MSQATLTTSAREFVEMKRAGKALDLIDVRTPVEYRGVHAEGARNIPLDRLDAARLPREKKGDEPIYLIWHSATRTAS